MKKTNNKGFSLVELIVVIAIMAVLIGVLAPQFLKYVERSRKSVDVQNVASIVTAVQTYAADPMVDTTNQIVDGETITIDDGADPVCSGKAALALSDAGVNTMRLKSTKWTPTAGDAIELEIDVAANGSVSLKCNTTLNAGHDILNGKYK